MLLRALEQANTIAIGGHVKPDGDCTGSVTGLYQYIKENYPEKKTDMYLEEVPDSFRFIPSTEEIKHEVLEEKSYDLFITLDCGDKKRLGFSAVLFDKAKNTLCIDHHISNQAFAGENYIEPEASSTSELVYRLLDKDKISKTTAESLYLGIVHDTGVFQYSCTSPETMEAAAQLMRKGIDSEKIIQKTFFEKTYAQQQILGNALLESIRFMDKQCIVTTITRKQMRFFGVTTKDLEGIVSQMRNTKGVEVAILRYETDAQEFKVSLRSTDKVDVSKVAAYYGGGGHKKAAGVTMAGSRHDVINNLAVQIALQLDKE